MLKYARQANVIVMEDFIVRQNLMGDRLLTVRLIGLVELMNRNKILFQQPAQKIGCPDVRLKKLKLYPRSPHIRDAIRHLIVYLDSLTGKRQASMIKKRVAGLRRKRLLDND